MSMFKINSVMLAFVAAGVVSTAISPLVYANEGDDKSSTKKAIKAEALAKTKKQQTNADEKTEIETIEVTGFSRSLIAAINQKRFTDTVSEQLSADDLGALPDVSMADALTRLPGISAVRTGGQAAQINIRGMSGGFVFSTLNGREQVSTSGSRSIEFDQYPSELISSGAVYKTPKASLIEGGVAGTVELTTASPLSNEENHKFNINARGMFNDRADEVQDAKELGHRLSFSYQGKYLEDTLGFAIGYARLLQPSVATQFIGFDYGDERDVDKVANDTGGTVDCPECEFLSAGFELQHRGGEEVRNGYMAAIEWAPVDDFTLKADAFVSKFDKENFARGFRVLFGGTTAAIGNPVYDGNAVIGGTFNRTSASSTHVEIVNDDNTDHDEIGSFGINAAWQATESLFISFDVSHSSAKSDFRNGLLWGLVAEDANADTPVVDNNVSISYLLNGNGLPDVGFNQADDFTDINKVMVSKYGIYPFQNEDALSAVRLDLKYELADNTVISSVEAGVRYSDREYSNDRSLFEYGDSGAFSVKEPPLRLTDDMVEVVDWQGEFSHFPSYLAVDLDQALNAWFPNGVPQPQQTWGGGAPGVINGEGNQNSTWSVLQSGEVYEKVFSAYLMANINTEFAGMDVTGNVGVRMVETDQSATILLDVGGDAASGAQNIIDDAGLINVNYAPAVLGTTYTDYLPSLNLNFHLTDNSQLRFAAAKVMSRPPINRLAGDASYQINDNITDEKRGEITGSANNSPFLLPFYANQYDLSYEYYFDDGAGAFVAALFYKDINSFIQNTGVDPFDFKANGFNVPETVDLEDPISGQFETVDTFNGQFTTAVNNKEGGYIRGLELAYTQIFSDLPDLWSGLGVNASYSYTQSEIQNIVNHGAVTVSQSLPGLSENVIATSLFWEHDGFETRISVRYRDEFVSEQWGVNEQVVNFGAETVIDYQASYQINDALGVVFQVNNLTDEPTKSYFGTVSKTGTQQYFGRQIFVGVNYSL